MSPRPPATSDEGGVLEEGLGSAWDRLAPLSLGAVASSAVIVAASAALRHLLGPRRRRALGWLGVAALLPLAVWVLWEEEESGDTDEAADQDEAEKDESGPAATNAEN